MISAFHDIALGHLDDLSRLILTMSESGAPSYPTMNVGGWKSDEKFFDTPHHAVMHLKMELEPYLLGMKYDGWAMVNRSGSYHTSHQHTNVLLSGVFYVYPGDPSTPTVFDVDLDGKRAKFTPNVSPGTLITFPEGMWHSVPIYRGSRPRITIVLNAKKELNR